MRTDAEREELLNTDKEWYSSDQDLCTTIKSMFDNDEKLRENG